MQTTVVIDKATGYAKWKRAAALTQADKDRRDSLRKLLGLRIGQVAAALPLEGFTYPADRTLLCKAWREKFRGWFIDGKSSTQLSDDDLHRFILAIESWASRDQGITFPDKDA